VDRLDAMRVFIVALDQGSLAAAARALKRSPASIGRAVAFLENHVGAQLLYRTTRAMRLSPAGERYATACRRILTELGEAELLAANERSAPHGILTISAPPIAGEEILQPIVDAFLRAYPSISIRMLFLDRSVNLVEERVDLALRVGRLPDSSLIAIKVGDNIRRVVAAAPLYLANHPRIEEPGDLARHSIVAMTNFGLDTWTFPSAPGSAAPRTVSFTPRIHVNSVRAAISSAVEGLGVTRLYLFHLADRVRDKELEIVLAHAEPRPVPVHLVTQSFQVSVPKVRAFIDFAAPLLRTKFSRQAREAGQMKRSPASVCFTRSAPS
jgi:DNA-binding transcriptional LysR family regulator